MTVGPLFSGEAETHIAALPAALGDCLASLPAVHYLAKKHAHVPFVFYVPDAYMAVVKLLLGPTKIGLRLKSRLEADKPYLKGLPARNYNITPPVVTTLRRHLTEQAFLTFLDVSMSDVPKRFLKYRTVSGIENRDEKIIAVHVAAAQKNRQLPESLFQSLVKEARARGYKVAAVGSTKSGEHVVPNYKDFCDLDLVDRFSSLLELFNFLRRCRAFIGPDGGLMHLAFCVKELPVLGYFTIVDPKHRLPLATKAPHFTVSPDLPCTFCQTRIAFLYDHDFRTCGYEHYDCVKTPIIEKTGGIISFFRAVI